MMQKMSMGLNGGWFFASELKAYENKIEKRFR